MTSRRKFLTASGLAIGAVGLRAAAQTPVDSKRSISQKAAKPLRLLILGGTGFIGPHEVRYAIERGHRITLFNRGKSQPSLFPEVEKLHGDRATGNYDSLKGREWDVVIDNPTTLPRWVRQAAEVLQKQVKQYIFISTVSVYAKSDRRNADETAEVATTDQPQSEDALKYYGALKALSEKEAQRSFGGRAAILRPGLIVGPGDLSDRFTYWPVRLEKGGEVLAPGSPTDPVQIIDARDLSEFVIRVAENNDTGVYNCTGPRSRLTIAEMLGGIRAVTTSDPYLTWVPADFLERHQVRPWVDMPTWVPSSEDRVGFATRNIDRALAKGLRFRPLAATARDTLDFYNSQPEARKEKLRAGLPADREKEVLAAWQVRPKP